MSIAVARIERALAKNDSKDALRQAERAQEQGVHHPLVLRLIADAHAEAGRFAQAGALLNQALKLNPSDPACLSSLGAVLIKEGRAEEALVPLSQALKGAPAYARGWLILANALEAQEKDENALAAYERAARLDPADSSAWAGKAELHLRGGRTDEAKAAVDAALALNPSNPVALLVSARIHLLKRSSEEARRGAESVIVRGKLAPFEQLIALKTLGDALDQLGRIPEAFAAYEKMNQTTADFYRPRFGPGGAVENHFSFIERLGQGYRLGAAGVKEPPGTPDQSPYDHHIFVLGYPRSGNTLVSAVLGSLPGARVLEERPTLMDADLEFFRDTEGLARLSTLDPDDAARLRGLYWGRVREEVGDLPGALLIDMAPFNSIKLPMIGALFPNARIVLCRRDPRDVVFSCWRQSFQPNASTYQMTDLVNAARHFEATMRLTEACRAVHPQPLYELDYEAFVADFERGARALLQGVGVQWSDAALDFAEAAKARQLRTASAAQIRGGLFDGRGQWRRYEAYLHPILPIVAPWIKGSQD